MKYLIASLLFFCSVSHANIGDDILKKYQSKLYTLPVVQQEHFSYRMYSITGDEQYLNPIMIYIFLLSTRFNNLMSNHDTSLLIDAETKRLLRVNEFDSDKKKSRVKMFEQDGEIAFYLNFLILIKKIHFYKLENKPFFKNISAGNHFLKSRASHLKHFILDEENIKIYGAQLINYVYYLHDLKLIDLRKTYTKKFRKVFQDTDDINLSDKDYAAKIYGMTHFILAASNYYQNEPNEQEFAWIIDYFDNHIDEIIKRTENDVIAEVGVCLMLVNKNQLPSVKKIKSYLNKVYDKDHQMIPDKLQSFDLAKGEHRNILTIMLFKWPKKLTPIPDAILQTMLSSGFILNKKKQEMNYGFNLIM